MTAEKAEPVAWQDIACTLCGIDGNGFYPMDCTPTMEEAYKIRAQAVVALYAAPARCDAQSVRASTIEECAKVCDAHARWASDKIPEYEAPDSERSQLFATTANAAADCAGLIRALSGVKPAQGAKLATLVLEYARDLRRNSSGGDDYPWEYAKATADYLEELVRRSETKPAQGDARSDEAPELLPEGDRQILAKLLRAIAGGTDAQSSKHDVIFLTAADWFDRWDTRPPEEAESALRDIISIAKDAQATDALGDIVRRAEEELGND